MNDQLHKHYGKQPIFYISKTFYHIVLMGNFSNTPLWVRDYEGKPELSKMDDNGSFGNIAKVER
jgi:lysozyme